MTDMLRADGQGRYTLLKCAHHGSRNSTPMDFLKAVRPVCTFISAGVDNSYSHPHRELIERLEEAGSRIYTTNETGAVRMDVKGEKIHIEMMIRRRNAQ